MKRKVLLFGLGVACAALVWGAASVSPDSVAHIRADSARLPPAQTTPGANAGPRVVATVAVGSTPVGVAVNPNTNLIYVANYGSNNVSVIDGASNTLVTAVAVGSGPYGVAVNPSTNRIYAATKNDNLLVIDGTNDSNPVVATVSVGSRPRGVAVNPSTNRIYVANGDGNTVSVIEDSPATVAATKEPSQPTTGAGDAQGTSAGSATGTESSSPFAGGTFLAFAAGVAVTILVGYGVWYGMRRRGRNQ